MPPRPKRPARPARPAAIAPESQADGIRCPKCRCADLRDPARWTPGDVPEWEVRKTVRVPHAIRRYRVCRNCGRRVRTREVIDKDLGK